jgi:hypothetical protein
MAAKSSRQAKNTSDRTSPIIGLLFAAAGAGLAILAGVVVFYWVFTAREETPTERTELKTEDPPPPAPPPPPPPKDVAWWDNVPDSSLAGTAAFLKEALPREQGLFESLGSKDDAVRLASYQKLVAKLAEMTRDPKAKIILESFVIECYTLDPSEKNTLLLRDWLVNQIPKENTEYSPDYKTDNLDLSFWALKISIDALTHKQAQLDRITPLSQALCKALGTDIDLANTPRAELQIKAEKLLALRCYRNLVPTSAKSIKNALAIREMLLKRAGEILSPASRLKVDLAMAVAGLPGAQAAWSGYGPLLRDCLEAKDMPTDLTIVDMYAKADPGLADKMETVLADRWDDALRDTKLNRKAKVAAMRKALGVPEPIDRRTQLEKLVKETLAGANSAPAKTRAVLQETVRLTHASTLACALLKKDAGQDRFDQLLALQLEIEPEPTPKTTASDDKTKKTPDDPKQPLGDPDPPKGGPMIIRGALRPGVPMNKHSVQLKQGRTYFIHLASNAFDAYLRLFNSRGVLLAQDDDSGGGLNALIRFTAPVTDKYTIVATSFGNRGVGTYTLSIEDARGFVAPGMGPPLPFPPPFPGRFPPPFPPPGLLPGQPPGVVPGEPKEKNPEKAQPPTPEKNTLVDEADLKNLATNVSKTRATAFLAIASKLKGSLSDKDLTLAHATKIAKYLVSIQDSAEVDDVTPQLTPFAKSRNLILALADAVDLDAARKETTETVVGALLEQPLLFSKEAWRPACRKLLLLQAIDLSAKNVGAADAADFLRGLYQEQGSLLGMDPKAFEKLTRPSQVLEKVIQHVASELGKKNPAKQEKEYLDQLPRHLLAAQFVAKNDLEHTVLLQRVWAEVLVNYLEQQNPSCAKELRRILADLTSADRGWANVLEQLRGGEDKILRMWSLALELK